MLSVSVFTNPQAASRLVVSHGNGLASMGYRKFWEPLLEHFEVISLDMRGHGSSEAGGVAMHTWEQFVADLQNVLSALAATDPRPLVGAFHSLSAVTSLLHMYRHPGSAPWKALVLYDPPLTAPEGHPLEKLHRQEMAELSDTAARRRRHYATVEERVAQFTRVDVFGRWVDGAPRDMAEATLQPRAGTQAWELSCDPEREAFIFRTGIQPCAWKLMKAPPCPIKLVGADPELANAGAPARSCRYAGETLPVTYDFVPGTGHFLQMEQPRACREQLLSFVSS